MEHMEARDKMHSVKACDAVYAWLRWIAAVLKVDQGFLEAMWLPKTSGRYLLTGDWCLAQTDTMTADMSKVGGSGTCCMLRDRKEQRFGRGPVLIGTSTTR